MKVIQVSLRHGTIENENVTTLVTYVECKKQLKVGARITLKDHPNSTWWWHVEKIYANSTADSTQLHSDWKVGGLV